MSLIAAVFGIEPSLKAKTVDAVMGAFHETIEKLHEVAEHHSDQVDRHNIEIKALEAKRLESVAEARRAMEVATKMAAVVGFPESMTTPAQAT